MKNYEIKRSFYHKGYVMLLSVVPTMTGISAMWSTHQFGMPHDKIPSLQDLAARFQRAHNMQIEKTIREEFLNEPEEFKYKTVQDITQQQLNATNELSN